MNSRRPVVVVGAGGFGRETASLLHCLRSDFDLLGFLDDNPGLCGRTVAGLPVLGSSDDIGAHPQAGIVVTIGNPRVYSSKRSMVERLGLPSQRYLTLCHPSVSLGTDVRVGEGTVILAGAVATHAVSIGRHVAMMPNVVLTHDDVVGDFAILGAGVNLAGGVVVEDGAYIGAGANVGAGIVVGAGAMVGMGAVVTRDVPSGEVWAGVPARRMR